MKVSSNCTQRSHTPPGSILSVILVDGDDVPTSLCERDKGFLDFWKVGRMERKKIQDGTIIDNVSLVPADDPAIIGYNELSTTGAQTALG